MNKPIYTIPKISKPKKGTSGWRVYFRYGGKLFQFKYGINYIKDLKERELEADALKEALHDRLKKGWNPNVPDLPELQCEDAPMTLSEALAFSLEKKKNSLSQRTYLNYSCTVNFVNTTIGALNLNKLLITDTKRIHIKTIIDKTKVMRQWSNCAYNKNVMHLKAILSELIQWNIIENNPANNIKSLPVAETNANIPATSEQQKIIKEHLEINHPDFYLFVITIFHTGIRPEEILKIKLSHIDLNRNEIILPPEITKTNRQRIVPINKHLKKYYEDLNLSCYPNDYYLFGKANKRDISFMLAPRRVNRETATAKWKRIVKDGLKIDVNLYSNKHAGANAKIMAGMDLDALRELYGHTSKLMTEKYAKVVKEVYRKQIMENSPDF